jgi:hypothetical protein
MADRKERFALISRYEKLHRFKYGEKPIINKNTAQWSADAILESFELHECYDILDYFFEIHPSPSWDTFTYHADKLYKSMEDKKQDDENRRLIRERARKWLST